MNQLYHGDCLDILRTLPEASIDLVLADPPYATTRMGWDKPLDWSLIWIELNRIIKPTCVMAIFAVEPFATQLRAGNMTQYKFDWLWKKSLKSGFVNAKNRPLKTIENICIFSQGKPRYYPQGLIPCKNPVPSGRGFDLQSPISGRGFKKGYTQTLTNYPCDIIEVKSERGYHPTQKPVALLEHLILHHSLAGETVLDFTMGSGSTGVACLGTGRRFIGVEKEATYYKTACERVLGADLAHPSMEE